MIHVHGVVYAMQHCLIRSVSDLLQVLQFSLPTKITFAALPKYSKTYFRLQIIRMTVDNLYHIRM
jgi:hypothetical protein